MSAFQISEAALGEIHRIFRQSECRDPVARLYERAEPSDLFDDLNSAIREGTRTRNELETIAKKRFEEVQHHLKSFLAVGACERTDFQAEHLHSTNGITLVMASEFVEMLRGYCLIFERDNFWLRGPDNVLHTLRSIMIKK
jgi:hypothetical protein